MWHASLKFLHILGVILLVGNVTITAFWKVLADRSDEPITVEHAQHLVTLTDWIFTIGGIVLILVGGYGMLRREPGWVPLADLGPTALFAIRTDMVNRIGPCSDNSSQNGKRFCEGPDDPQALLATRPALDHMGRDRDRAADCRYLCNDRKALEIGLPRTIPLRVINEPRSCAAVRAARELIDQSLAISVVARQSKVRARDNQDRTAATAGPIWGCILAFNYLAGATPVKSGLSGHRLRRLRT